MRLPELAHLGPETPMYTHTHEVSFLHRTSRLHVTVLALVGEALLHPHTLVRLQAWPRVFWRANPSHGHRAKRVSGASASAAVLREGMPTRMFKRRVPSVSSQYPDHLAAHLVSHPPQTLGI